MNTQTGWIAILALVVVQASGGEPTCVGFRNDGTGHYEGRIVDRFDLPTRANIRWQADLPDYGVSSPIVVRAGQNGATGDLAIVTCDPDRVIAYRLADGKEVWNGGIGVSALLKPAHDSALRDVGRWSGAASIYPQHIIPQIRMLNPRDPSTHWTPEPAFGWSVATPLSDGVRVWAVGYRGAVGCLGMDGQLKWKVFVSDTCKGSPCLVDGTLVVTGEKAVFGLDPNTGSNRWQTAFPRVPGKADMQTLRGTTPAVWRHQGRSILLWSIGFAVDAGDGADLSGECPRVPDNSPCLVMGDRMVGRYSRSRRNDAPPADGEPPTPWQLIAWDLSLVDGKLNLKRAWTQPPDDRFMENGPNGSVSAGLLRIGDMVVCGLPDEGTSDKGLAAVKVSDGTVQDTGCAVPRSSRGPFLQPSPAVAGDRLVVADQDGTVTIIDIAQFPWRVLGRASVATPANRGKTGAVIGASPCISGDIMLIRTSRELICVGPK